ncbi:MAG: winged helix-turn-helix domain-containing protein [Candidatus Hodarchaeales archaeon]|jgi:predicted transcriptional regulator
MVERIRTYRDHLAEILRLSAAGAKKTQLVYKANLNFKIVKPLLSRLIEHGLLEHSNKTYYTTEKGNTFVHHFENMNGLMKNG